MSDYPPGPPKRVRRQLSASTRLIVAFSFGALAGAIASFAVPWQAAPLIGWGVASVLWFGPTWVKILRFDAVETSEQATLEDPTRALADFVLLAASIASLVAIALVTVKAARAHGGAKALLVTVAIGSVVASWAVVHTVFTLRYAALYYTGVDGGIDFNEDDKPSYHDFAYLAFTIGMTYQVSDTDLTTKEVRHTALRHAMLSYLLGTVIIAATINLVAGLVK
jgi:uncharacterized membrane protein